MANRMKEEEKNEKIIRGLLKLPANKRCINCNNLGPQYVCTNFWTFICTNCSGVHREFTHRVKSVSMAKFTSQEVAALQEGGNERAREIFFKELDPQRNQFPDSSNIDRLRDFIKHVYEDRRFTGDRRPSKPKADIEGTSDSRRPDSYRGGSRSPPYNERYNESPGYNSRNTPNERNPRYSYGERSPGGYRRGPQQKVDERRVPEGTKPQGVSPDYQENTGSSPPVRPVRDILGNDVPPLRVGELPKLNATKVVVNPLPPPQVERTSSASSIGSGPGDSTTAQPSMQTTVQPAVQPKKEEPPPIVSLIDFSADLEPPSGSLSAPQPQVQPQAQTQLGLPQRTNSPSVSTNNSDWSAFDAFSAQKAVSPVATNANPLDSALSQLSLSGSPMAPPCHADSSPKSINGIQLPATQSSLFNAPSLVVAPGNQQFGAPVAPPNQPQSSTQPSIPTNNAQPPQENPAPSENKPSARKALPEDFFTSLYPPAASTMPGWSRGPQFGMGYGMQYPAAMVMPNYPQPQSQPQPMTSVNPFDIGSEPIPAQASAQPFSSMGPGLMQGAPPSMNMPPQQPLMRSSSVESISPRWMAPQKMPYASAVPPSQYMMQQVPGTIPHQMPSNMMPVMQQGALGQSNTGVTPFGASLSDPNLAGRYSQPNTPSNSFGTVGGNPFG